MVYTAGMQSNDAAAGASTPSMVNTAGRESKGAPTSASTPGRGAPRRKSLLQYKSPKNGARTSSTKRAWLAHPFMTDRDVVPGPSYYPSDFGNQLGIGARTIKLTKGMYTDWAKTCLPDDDGGAEGMHDRGWSPTRSLAVRTAKRVTYYYKAGDEVNGVREYDLQFLFPEKMPGKVDKDTVVKGMQDFARRAVEVARVKDLSKNAVVVMMKREMDIGAIEFDTETEEDILVFTHKLATKAGLY